MKYATTPPVNPRTEPAERSIFPETMTISIPTAMIAVTDICVMRLEMLRAVRKVVPVAQSKYPQMTASTANMMYALRAVAPITRFFGSSILVMAGRRGHDEL